MGLFKKIGEAVKKGAKQISLKNIVKVGTPLLSAIPVVGGIAHSVVSNISAAHEAKKAEKAAIEANNEAQAEYYRQLAEQQAILAGAQVGQQGGSVLNAFTKGVTNELVEQTNVSAKQAVGQAGATVVDFTISEWFKLHLKQILIGLGILAGLIFFWKKKNNGNKRKVRR